MEHSNTSYFGLNKLAIGSRRRKKNAPETLASQAMAVSEAAETVEVTTDFDDGGNGGGGGGNGNSGGGGNDNSGGGGGGTGGTGAGGTSSLAVIKMTIKNSNGGNSNGGGNKDGKDGDNDGGNDGGNNGGNGGGNNGGNGNVGRGRIAVKFKRGNPPAEEPAIQIDTSVETEEYSSPDGVQQVRGGVVEQEDENGCCVKTLAFSMEACGCSIL